jgi:hypothetical protein
MLPNDTSSGSSPSVRLSGPGCRGRRLRGLGARAPARTSLWQLRFEVPRALRWRSAAEVEVPLACLVHGHVALGLRCTSVSLRACLQFR